MISTDLLFGLLLIICVLLVVKTRKLSNLGGVAAALVAICIYIGTGFSGLSLLALFFIAGVAATRWKRDEKRRLKPVEEHQEERNAKQVLANGGIAALCGIGCAVFEDYHFIFYLAMACSLSAAIADTVSSELGMVYGKKQFNILSWKTDERGNDGVISIEGTLLGLLGSLLVTLLYAATSAGWNLYAMMTVAVAGTVGNIADSVLGATFERNNIIGNNAVNLLNTFIAALMGALLA